MKSKIIRILINAVIGVVTSVASLYLGADAVETIAASGTAAAAMGDRVTNTLRAVFA